MIKELNELVWYARKSVWRADEMLAFLCDDRPEVLHLYRLLSKQEFRTDEDVAIALDMGLTSYKKYGGLLRDHLRDMVTFFNDEKAGVDITVKNIFDGARDLAVMRMLSWRSCRVAGREMAQRLLRRGMFYEWPEFVVEAALIFKESVIRLGGNMREYEYYDQIMRRYQHFLDLERLSYDYYQRTKLQSKSRASKDEALAGQIQGYLGELTPHVGTTASYFFHLYYYTLRNHYHIHMADYAGLRQNCEEAIGFFRSRKYPVVNPISIFYYTKVVAHTMLGEYEAGREDAETSLQILEEGTANWFNAMEVYIYLAIHTGHYEKAFDLYQSAYSHRRRPSLPPGRQEVWHTLGAYCNILQRMTETPAPARFPVFRSRQFLNNIQSFSKDKTGMYVAILIAHALLQLLEGKEELFKERLKTLERYRNRYLRKEGGTFRSVTLIRILGLLPKTDFRQEAFLQHAQPYLRQLNKAPLQLADQAYELEIIPYEHLVQLIAGYLGRRGSRR